MAVCWADRVVVINDYPTLIGASASGRVAEILMKTAQPGFLLLNSNITAIHWTLINVDSRPMNRHSLETSSFHICFRSPRYHPYSEADQILIY